MRKGESDVYHNRNDLESKLYFNVQSHNIQNDYDTSSVVIKSRNLGMKVNKSADASSKRGIHP